MSYIQHPCFRLSVLASAMALASVSAQAATRIDLHSADASQFNQRYQGVTKQVGAPAMASVRHAEMLDMDPESSLQQLAVKRDNNGTSHYRYQQLYRGVPVFGKHIIVSETSTGAIRNLFGGMITDLDADLPSVRPKLNKSQALAAAKRTAFGARVTAMNIQREHARLMIFAEGKDRARLSWVVEIFADTSGGGRPTRPFVIVDAQSGRILKHWDGLTTAEIGTGPGGNIKTGQYNWGSGGLYGFLDVAVSGPTCTMDNTDVRSVNLNGSTGNSTTAFSYTCPNNTYKTINGAYSPINDAHYFGGVIQDMYNAYTGSNALTFQLVMRVHYGTNYENAFWDGTKMTFGDGASTFYPLVSADVAGHEVSHGYTEQHSDLLYFGQSGGMNEAYSDIAGEATEYYWKGTNDFQVGAEIFKLPGQALRYMNNPPQDGGSIDSANDFFGSLDVHYSSGVYNKAFYLLATTPGWDTPKAFKVFARANELYWTPDSSFYDGACGAETAASDLGYTVANVTAALASVDVDCGGGVIDGGVLVNGVPKTGQAVSGPDELGYTVNVPGGATNLVISTSGGSGDGDLYVNFGPPLYGNYDCTSLGNGNTESCSFPVPQTGAYYVRIRPYTPVSGLSVVANYSGGSGGGGDTDGGALTNGLTVNGITKTDGSVTYHLDVPKVATLLTFTISGGTGNADLYMKRGSVPSDSSFDCRPLKSDNVESCQLLVALPGTYYVQLKANPSFANVSLTTSYNSVP